MRRTLVIGLSLLAPPLQPTASRRWLMQGHPLSAVGRRDGTRGYVQGVCGYFYGLFDSVQSTHFHVQTTPLDMYTNKASCIRRILPLGRISTRPDPARRLPPAHFNFPHSGCACNVCHPTLE